MEDLIDVFKEKIEKHANKLKDHKQTEEILRADYKYLQERDPEKAERIGEKLLSTVKNIEYHIAKYKTYKKVVEMMEQRS